MHSVGDSSRKESDISQRHGKEKSRASSERQEKNKDTVKMLKDKDVKKISTGPKIGTEKQTISSKKDSLKELPTVSHSTNTIPVLVSRSVGQSQGTFVQHVQGVKTSTVTTPVAAGRGRPIATQPLGGSRFLKPADFVPRPFQMKVLDGKAKLPRPVLKCFSEDGDVGNIATPQEKTKIPASSSAGQSDNRVKTESIFPDASFEKKQNTAVSTQSSDMALQNREVISIAEGNSKHSRIVLPPSRKRKAESDDERSRARILTSQKTAPQATQNEFKQAGNSNQQMRVREESRETVTKPIKQEKLIKEKDYSTKRTVVQLSSAEQRVTEKDKRREKLKQENDELLPKDSKRDDRERQQRTKDHGRESSNSKSAEKRKEPSPGFYLIYYYY